MATVVVLLVNEPRKDGLVPVKVRLGVDRKYSYETMFYIRPTYWNAVSHQVRVYEPAYRELNDLLATRLGQVAELIEAYKKRGWPFTARQLLEVDYAAFRAQEDNARSLALPAGEPIGYCTYITEVIMPYWQKKNNLRRAEGYRMVRDVFRSFLATQRPQKVDVSMSQFNSGLIERYFAYLKVKPQPSGKDSTLRRHLADIMAVLRFAHRKGVLVSVPDLSVDFDIRKSKKTKLNSANLADLERYLESPVEGELHCETVAGNISKWSGRTPWAKASARRRVSVQTFLLQYYLFGARVGDVMMLRNSNVITRGGVAVKVEYYQQKGRKGQGKRLMSITLQPVARQIVMEFLRANDPDAFLLPWLASRWERDVRLSPAENDYQLELAVSSATSTMNASLRKACGIMGLDAPSFSSHSARHTYAQRAKRKGKSIEWIKETLGHSNYDITAHYLDDLDAEELDANMTDVYD